MADKYIALCNTPFDNEQNQALATIISDNGYIPIIIKNTDIRHNETPADFPCDKCVAVLGTVTRAFVEKLSALVWTQMSWVGIDALREAVFARPDMTLSNASGGYGPTIAEYMLGATLLLLHNFNEYIHAQPKKQWERIGVTRTLYNAVVMVIGLGDIGGRFARYAKTLGATVRGVRRTEGLPIDGVDEIIPYDRLINRLGDADVVAMCLPATNNTNKLLSASHIAAMKPGAILVNSGRGSTLDEEALISALQSHRLGGAVLDVAQTEPIPEDNPLWTLDNVVITPHIAGRMDDPTNAGMIYRIFEDNLNRFVRGQPLTHVVDRAIGY